MPRRATSRGFTLIELLLVLVILAVLAAVVVPKFTGRSQEARITAAKTDISNMETALDAYDVDIGKYPETLNALVEQPANTPNWKGYIKKLPNDPWGNPYNYKYPGDHGSNTYDLWSFGPDGREGGDDDIVNWQESK